MSRYGANDWLRELILLVEARGWAVVGYSGRKPYTLTVTNMRGVTVTIEDDTPGLHMKDAIQGLQMSEEPVHA